MGSGVMAKALQLFGDKALMKTLKTLPIVVGGKVMKMAMRAGAKPIIKVTKEKAPVGPTGNLSKNIWGRLKVYKQSETAVIVIGGKWPKAAHAHLVEFGHGGPHPAPPHPFMRPAFDATKGLSMQKMEKSFRSGIKRAVKKLAK